jgi:hypothetical protein
VEICGGIFSETAMLLMKYQKVLVKLHYFVQLFGLEEWMLTGNLK